MRFLRYNRFQKHIRSQAAAFFLLLAGVCCSFFWCPDSAVAATTLKIGIYNNPPIVFVDDKGTPQGVYVDTLNAIAALEDWKLDYVYGPWSELLEKIQKGEIDVLTAIAYSAERDAYLDFNREAFAERWGVVFVPAGSTVKSMSDLAGKRIALAVKDIHGGFFRQAIDLRGIDLQLIEVSGYEAVFEKLRKKEADAGVVSSGYGFSHAETYGLLPTSLTFKPIRLVNAFTEGRHRDISNTIDTYLKKWKIDPQSPYRLSHQRWLGMQRGEERKLSLSQQEMDWLAGHKHKTIQVAFDGHFPPYSIQDDDGNFSGLAVDIMRVLAERVGITMEIFPKTVWKDLYQAAQNRDVDVVATMGRQPEREEWFVFTQPYIFKSMVIMTRTDNETIRQPEDLAGKNVAMVKGYQYVRHILEKYPSIKPDFVDTMLDAMNAVAVGRADAAITFLGAGHYYKTKYQLANLKFAAIYDRDRFKESIAVRKDWPELASILDKAIESVSSQEMISLQKKWLPVSDTDTTSLTDKEIAWIRAHPRIRIGVNPDFAPYAFIAEDGAFIGIAADYIKLFNKRFGLNMQVVLGLTWKEVVEKIKIKEIDVIPGLTVNEEKMAFLDFSNPYINFYRVVITRKDSPLLTGIEDIKDMRVAVQSDTACEVYLKENTAIKALSYKTLQEALLAVSTGKADALIHNLASASFWITKQGLTNLKVALPISEGSGTLHIAVRKDWPELIGILNKGLAAISPEEKVDIQRRWVDVEYTSGIAPGTVFKYLSLAFGIMVLSAAGFTIWNRTLKKEVVRKTQELHQELGARKQADDEIKTANAELLAINRIVQTCSRTLKLKEILENVLDESLEITGLEGGTICMVTPDETLELAVHRATSEETIIDLTTNNVKVGDCLCGECARDHKPLILPDRKAVLSFSTREATRGEDIRFHAAFPLTTGGKCLGVLCVFTRTDKKPLERSLKLLETITAQIALAVENARLYEETVRHAATLEDKVKERTQELSESQKALMFLLEDVNEANEKLKELDRLKSMFIASMSHELRTPLNSIIGFTGIILKGMTGEINAEQLDQLERVFRAGKHLLSLITDVIDISKIEAGKMAPFAGEFLLEDVIDEALGGVRKQAQDQGLDLEKQLPEKSVRMYTDRRRLLQCLLNLLSNAVKFTEKGFINLSASDENGSVRISVSDSGIGIKPEKIQFLFMSFVRLESHLQTSKPGTGLGLYLTKKIATEVLGGDVFARSTEHVGSTFTIVIPKHLTSGKKHV